MFKTQPTGATMEGMPMLQRLARRWFASGVRGMGRKCFPRTSGMNFAGSIRLEQKKLKPRGNLFLNFQRGTSCAHFLGCPWATQRNIYTCYSAGRANLPGLGRGEVGGENKSHTLIISLQLLAAWIWVVPSNTCTWGGQLPTDQNLRVLNPYKFSTCIQPHSVGSWNFDHGPMGYLEEQNTSVMVQGD